MDTRIRIQQLLEETQVFFLCPGTIKRDTMEEMGKGSCMPDFRSERKRPKSGHVVLEEPGNVEDELWKKTEGIQCHLLFHCTWIWTLGTGKLPRIIR